MNSLTSQDSTNTVLAGAVGVVAAGALAYTTHKYWQYQVNFCVDMQQTYHHPLIILRSIQAQNLHSPLSSLSIFHIPPLSIEFV